MHSRHPLLLGGEEEVELLAVVVHAEEEDAPCISLDNTAGEGERGREGGCEWSVGRRGGNEEACECWRGRWEGGRGGTSMWYVGGAGSVYVRMWLVYRKGYSKPQLNKGYDYVHTYVTCIMCHYGNLLWLHIIMCNSNTQVPIYLRNILYAGDKKLPNALLVGGRRQLLYFQA